MKLVLDKSKFPLEQLFNLDKLVDDGELDELEAFEIINLFPTSVADGVLKNWVKKLAHRGTITISCTDMYSVMKLLRMRQISIDQANNLLFGENGEKKAAYSNEVLKTTLENLGLKIMKNRNYECNSLIVAQRP